MVVKGVNMKKKTYVLMVSPMFEKPILEGKKIHTLRKNYKFWKKRIEAVNRGEAILSMRVWTGKPYHSKQREFLALDKAGIERVLLEHDGLTPDCPFTLYRSPNESYAEQLLPEEIAQNDGLSLEDFKVWFEKYLDGYMACIHFTEFRYREISKCQRSDYADGLLPRTEVFAGGE
ncbi:hypothetical protein FACS1894151_07490 [Spirochaetia bacterium]|nr:hypothetical protein FACS1894151_07490 [Spirochaetia bacterium]